MRHKAGGQSPPLKKKKIHPQSKLEETHFQGIIPIIALCSMQKKKKKITRLLTVGG